MYRSLALVWSLLWCVDAMACAADQVFHSSTVSAGVVANFLGGGGSLAGDMPGIVGRGVDMARAAHEACGSAPSSVKIGIVPVRYRTRFGEDAECSALLARTARSPLRYFGRRFGSVDDLVNWFARFSQGRGSDGAQLYRDCPGLCSPRYFAELRPDQRGLVADVSVLCGPARDKRDNRYRVKAAVGRQGASTPAEWLR